VGRGDGRGCGGALVHVAYGVAVGFLDGPRHSMAAVHITLFGDRSRRSHSKTIYH
jgi:hypothetical protein